MPGWQARDRVAIQPAFRDLFPESVAVAATLTCRVRSQLLEAVEVEEEEKVVRRLFPEPGIGEAASMANCLKHPRTVRRRVEIRLRRRVHAKPGRQRAPGDYSARTESGGKDAWGHEPPRPPEDLAHAHMAHRVDVQADFSTSHSAVRDRAGLTVPPPGREPRRGWLGWFRSCVRTGSAAAHRRERN
jgi:hypothetical protein